MSHIGLIFAAYVYLPAAVVAQCISPSFALVFVFVFVFVVMIVLLMFPQANVGLALVVVVVVCCLSWFLCRCWLLSFLSHVGLL